MVLRLGRFEPAQREIHSWTLPTWERFLKHPNTTRSGGAGDAYLRPAQGAELERGGLVGPGGRLWSDENLRDFVRRDPDHLNYLAAGVESRRLGRRRGARWEIRFGSDTALYFGENRRRRGAYWLRTREAAGERGRCCFRPAARSGYNLMRGRRVRRETGVVFLRGWETSFDAPAAAAGAFEVTSAIRASGTLPAPTIDMTYPDDHPGGWYTWLVEDHDFRSRPDVELEAEELKKM